MAYRCGTSSTPLTGSKPRRWWVSSAQQPSLTYQVPVGTGAPTTIGPSVAGSMRPSRNWIGAGGAFGGRTAPLTTCSIVAGTAERCGKKTSTQATYGVGGAIGTEVV